MNESVKTSRGIVITLWLFSSLAGIILILNFSYSLLLFMLSFFIPFYITALQVETTSANFVIPTDSPYYNLCNNILKLRFNEYLKSIDTNETEKYVYENNKLKEEILSGICQLKKDEEDLGAI